MAIELVAGSGTSRRDRADRGRMGFRVIGAFKPGKSFLLLALGVSLIQLLHRDIGATLEHSIELLRLDPGNQYLHEAIAHIAGTDRANLRAIEAGTFVYALIYAVEGVGLLLRRR